MDKAALIVFEEDIAAEFNAGKIRAPIHLSEGNEDALISYFAANVRPDDWICCTWRSHFHCLLKGVPPAEVKASIMAGNSISLCFPKHRIVSSAIVGGILPIALGIAMGIKRDGGSEYVHCFMGDMTAMTGIAHECKQYSLNFSLPIIWVTENNGKSVCTDTSVAWGRGVDIGIKNSQEHFYSYESKWPHSGAGKRIEF